MEVRIEPAEKDTDNLSEVGEELQRFQKGERDDGRKISMKGINGVDYEVFVKPRIREEPRENEYFGDARFLDSQSAYLPMRIFAPIMFSSDDPEYRETPAPPAEDFSIY
ncbi:hypothetical protein F5B18DRAFT_646457 [Nemania serpens]|nr:hypothetical protein F5B18DRAFT_646457 [Nemania serpens]